MMALFLALLALATISLARRDAGKVLLTAVLLGNWAVNSGFCWVTGDPNPWPFFLVVDYLSGLILIGFRSSRWQSAIVLTYVAQLVTHAGYGWSRQDYGAQDAYWLILYVIAWGQIAIGGAWIGYDMVGRRAGASGGVALGDASLRKEER